MRISDWSSDVCSSDLVGRVERQLLRRIERRQIVEIDAVTDDFGIVEIDGNELGQGEIALPILGGADFALHRVAGAQAEFAHLVGRDKIGRASCWERVCQYC